MGEWGGFTKSAITKRGTNARFVGVRSPVDTERLGGVEWPLPSSLLLYRYDGVTSVIGKGNSGVTNCMPE